MRVVVSITFADDPKGVSILEFPETVGGTTDAIVSLTLFDPNWRKRFGGIVKCIAAEKDRYYPTRPFDLAAIIWIAEDSRLKPDETGKAPRLNFPRP